MLKDEVAIVNGSTSGNGLGISRELTRLDADIVLNEVSERGEHP